MSGWIVGKRGLRSDRDVACIGEPRLIGHVAILPRVSRLSAGGVVSCPQSMTPVGAVADLPV